MVSRLKKVITLLSLLIIAACASYDGRGLPVGASVDDVLAAMGEPAMRWRDADGSQQLAFPRGPAGVHTFMAFFVPDGRLIRIDNVLQQRYFAQILPGKHDQAAILRLLGPSAPHGTAYFAARNELVWEWLFCNEWNRLAWFDVLFDGTSGLVRTTYQRPELRGPDGIEPWCSQ